jgi:Restriction endonuclease
VRAVHRSSPTSSIGLCGRARKIAKPVRNMNTTSIGDSLEANIFDLFQTEIKTNRFWAKKENCRLFRKKGYHSKDRGDNIVFDLAIEIRLPDARDFSVLVLVECKNYSHPVPVDDAEEFFAKVQQISGANVKAVIASTASFQSGTRAFAKSKGMGLLRYFDKTHFKWELQRSPSASARSTDANSAQMVEDGLARQDFASTAFDLFLQSPARGTNSLWDFIEDIALDTTLTPTEIRKVANSRAALPAKSRSWRRLNLKPLPPKLSRRSITQPERYHLRRSVN